MRVPVAREWEHGRRLEASLKMQVPVTWYRSHPEPSMVKRMSLSRKITQFRGTDRQSPDTSNGVFLLYRQHQGTGTPPHPAATYRV